jgi:hypothetical protein
MHRHLDFSVGVFGAESAVRADLVPVAQRTAHVAYGSQPTEAATVLVRDTPRDIRAGRSGAPDRAGAQGRVVRTLNIA